MARSNSSSFMPAPVILDYWGIDKGVCKLAKPLTHITVIGNFHDTAACVTGLSVRFIKGVPGILTITSDEVLKNHHIKAVVLSNKGIISLPDWAVDTPAESRPVVTIEVPPSVKTADIRPGKGSGYLLDHRLEHSLHIHFLRSDHEVDMQYPAIEIICYRPDGKTSPVEKPYAACAA